MNIGNGEVKWEVRVALVDEVVGCESSGGMCCVIVRDFGESEIRRPLCGFVASKHAEVLFKGSVSTFGLAVCLWVVGRRKAKSCVCY